MVLLLPADMDAAKPFRLQQCFFRELVEAVPVQRANLAARHEQLPLLPLGAACPWPSPSSLT